MKIHGKLKSADDISIKYVEKVLLKAFPDDINYPHTYAYNHLISIKGGVRTDWEAEQLDDENLVILALAHLMKTNAVDILMAIKGKKQLKSIQFFLGMDEDVIQELCVE